MQFGSSLYRERTCFSNQRNSGAGEDLVPESTCQVEAGEGRVERRRRRCRFDGDVGYNALRRFWSPQWYRWPTHRLRYQDRGADTSAREPSGCQIASSSSGEVREGTASEANTILGRERITGSGVGVGWHLGTSKFISEPDWPGAAATGSRYGSRDRGWRWFEGLRGASASSWSRILREVVNVVRMMNWTPGTLRRERKR